MYSFALRPRWILGHVLVVTLVVALANLGLWQLRRLEERRDLNAVVEHRSKQTVPLPAEGWEGADGSALIFRRVQVTGRYDPDSEVLLRFRTRLGVPGHHVLTPLITERGTVLVNRGWVPLDIAEKWPTQGARPPPGPVQITGVLRSSEGGSRFLPQRPRPDGPLTVGAIDISGLSRRLSRPLYPLYVQLDPAGEAEISYPVAVEPLPLGDGPHLSYALQWFAFASIAALGWVILVRQSAKPSVVTPR